MPPALTHWHWGGKSAEPGRIPITAVHTLPPAPRNTAPPALGASLKGTEALFLVKSVCSLAGEDTGLWCIVLDQLGNFYQGPII